MSEPRRPLFVIAEGPEAGRGFALPSGHVVLGRAPDADVALSSANVSRHHARIWRAQDLVGIEDLHSANGTWVDGEQVHGMCWLSAGAEIRLGDVVIAYLGSAADVGAAASPRASYEFGAVGGSVNTGSGVQYNAGRDVVHGDVHGDTYEMDWFTDPMQEMVAGKGPGRLMTIIGGLVAALGLGLIFVTILSGMSGFTDFAPTEPGQMPGLPPNPFDRTILGIKAFPLGFGLVLVGGIVMSVGASMSKKARRRAQGRGW